MLIKIMALIQNWALIEGVVSIVDSGVYVCWYWFSINWHQAMVIDRIDPISYVLQIADSFPGHRIIKTHMPLRYFKPQLDSDPSLKVIQVLRNPRDAIVSLYRYSFLLVEYQRFYWGAVKLIFTQVINCVPLEQFYHKLIGMCGAGTTSICSHWFVMELL